MSELLNVVVVLGTCVVRGSIRNTVEETGQHNWLATWAFPVREGAAHREGYDRSEIRGTFSFDPAFPGCPGCRVANFFRCLAGEWVAGAVSRRSPAPGVGNRSGSTVRLIGLPPGPTADPAEAAMRPTAARRNNRVEREISSTGPYAAFMAFDAPSREVIRRARPRTRPWHHDWLPASRPCAPSELVPDVSIKSQARSIISSYPRPPNSSLNHVGIIFLFLPSPFYSAANLIQHRFTFSNHLAYLPSNRVLHDCDSTILSGYYD